MAQAHWYARGEEVVEGTVHLNRLKAMYIANIVIAGPLGLAALLVPETTRQMMGFPAVEPIAFGVGMGAIPLGFGLAGILGVYAPLRTSPVLGLQALYKSIFLVAVILPLAATGQIPSYTAPIIAIFVFFIVGDLLALPFSYLFSRPAEA